MTECATAFQQDDKVTQMLARAAHRYRLLTVHWELTYRCNTVCTHCYAVKPGDHGFVAPAPELSTEEAFRVIDQLANAKALQIVFSGGEILTRKDFLPIARYARQKLFLLRLLTNGTLVTPERADAIADLRPMSVEISLYGATPEVHDAVTLRPGSFRKVISAFTLLRARGVRTVMKVPVMRENAHQFGGMKNLAAELGASFSWDSGIVAKDNGELTPLQHRLDDEALLAFFRAELSPEYAPRTVTLDDKHCYSGMHTVAVDPYGEVFSCIQYRHSAGNLRRQPLGQILTESPVLNHMRAVTVGSFPVCSGCELKTVCMRCPGATENEGGDHLGPSPEACRQSYLRYKVLQERGVVPAGPTPLPASWIVGLERSSGVSASPPPILPVGLAHARAVP